ncbi:MAG TPA: 3-hydroxyacyl-CoA dehydrogenase NAD-binding domain-containing protein [Rhodoblastus sp.]|nr:3-hydroxyacyl-CoA dehydrogenase NAD-binding domain-containing protein [Rhodoblastus sp.]
MIRTERHDDILEIVASNPPVNALSPNMRQELFDAFNAANADAAVRGIVLRCDGPGFFAGADIGTLGRASDAPPLPHLVSAIEASAKPVVAAIHGRALGGGLEIALGCHYRVAAAGAKLGLPEVKLGLLPGAGGTQRLPRLVGVAAALNMIVFGDPIDGSKALAIRLVDEIASAETLIEAAVSLARSKVSEVSLPKASSRNDQIGDKASLEAAIRRLRQENSGRWKGLIAPDACIAAVAAAVELPFDEGMAKERTLFGMLLKSEQSKALRHNFFAERTAARIKDLPEGTAVLSIERVGIIGAGTMGGGIAMNFLSIGASVTIIDRDQASLDRGVSAIRRNYMRRASRGRISEADVERAMSLLTATLDFDALADCDLIIEAAFENMAVKKDIFRRLDAVAKSGAILASNTSRLDINAMAAETARPESVLGLHFFSPANVMRLLEVVRAKDTGFPQLATAMSLAKKIGKVAVVSGVCPGFIGNRMLGLRQRQAQRMILEGAMPWDVDKVLTDFGFPMGPFQMSDLAGLDLGWSRQTSKGDSIRDLLCERDRRGQKTSRGYYDYDENRIPSASPEVVEIISEFAKAKGYKRRSFTPKQIEERLLYPMINEGAKIIEEGIAQRASDIDVVWINGYGWPAYTGGPMHWASNVGIDKIVHSLSAMGPQLGADFSFSSLLLEKAEANQAF